MQILLYLIKWQKYFGSYYFSEYLSVALRFKSQDILFFTWLVIQIRHTVKCILNCPAVCLSQVLNTDRNIQHGVPVLFSRACFSWERICPFLTRKADLLFRYYLSVLLAGCWLLCPLCWSLFLPLQEIKPLGLLNCLIYMEMLILCSGSLLSHFG